MKDAPDFSPTAVDVVLRPEWEVTQDNEKNLVFTTGDMGYGDSYSGIYVVPAGKTLYVTGLSWALYAAAAASGDLNQFGVATLLRGATELIQFGGNGGSAVSLSRPYKFAAGSTLMATMTSLANHVTNGIICIQGYEV